MVAQNKIIQHSFFWKILKFKLIFFFWGKKEGKTGSTQVGKTKHTNSAPFGCIVFFY